MCDTVYIIYVYRRHIHTQRYINIRDQVTRKLIFPWVLLNISCFIKAKSHLSVCVPPPNQSLVCKRVWLQAAVRQLFCNWEGSAEGQVLGAFQPETGSLQQLPLSLLECRFL